MTPRHRLRYETAGDSLGHHRTRRRDRAGRRRVARGGNRRKPNPLIRDDFARILVSSAGPAWARLADPELAWLDGDEHGRRAHRLGIDYQAVRTHFFDEYFADAVERRNPAGGDPGRRAGLAGLPPGLAGRHRGLRDRPAQGAGIQDRHSGVTRRGPTASRRTVPVDLRDDWPAALAAAGFDRTRPTAWLAEGLLPVPAKRCSGPALRDVHRAERPGQPGRHRGVRHELAAAIPQRWLRMRERLGLDVNVEALTYPRARPFGCRPVADRPRLAGARREQPRRDGPAGPPGTRRPGRRRRAQHAAAGASRRAVHLTNERSKEQLDELTAHPRRHLGHQDQRRQHRGDGGRRPGRRNRAARRADPRPVRQASGHRRRRRRFVGGHARPRGRGQDRSPRRRIRGAPRSTCAATRRCGRTSSTPTSPTPSPPESARW